MPSLHPVVPEWSFRMFVHDLMNCRRAKISSGLAVELDLVFDQNLDKIRSDYHPARI